MDIFGFAPVGVFGFVILLVLIGSFFQYLKVRSNNETIRTLAQSGQDIDPKLLRQLGRDRSESEGGTLTGGVIVSAVAVGLYIFGRFLAAADGDPEISIIFAGIASLVGCIGGALLLVGIFQAMARRGKDDADV